MITIKFGQDFRKNTIKVGLAVVTMSVLVLGGAGCGTGGGSNMGGTVTSRENNENNEVKTLYPIPEKNKTVEEIKAEGGEVTPDDVNNAANYFIYLLTLKTFGNNEYVSGEFQSITVSKIKEKTVDNKTVAHDAPFYYPSYDGTYEISLNRNQAMGDVRIPLPSLYQFPEEFSEILEALGAEKILVTEEYLNESLKDFPTTKKPYLIGQYVYSPIVIDEELISQISDEETLGLILEMLDGLIQELEKQRNSSES